MSKYCHSTVNQLDLSLGQIPPSQPESNKHLTKSSVSLTTILFKQFNIYSITFPLSILLFVYFWVLFIYQQATDKLFGCVLYDVGAKFTPSIKYNGEFHRMIVSIPLFGGISQILIGFITIQMYGYVAENNFGKIKYLIILLLSGYSSNLLSCLIYPYNVSVGSYGIIYAILVIYGTVIATQEMGRYKKLILAIYVLMFGLNFIPLVGINQLDIGCIVGAIISTLLMTIFFQKIESSYGKYINYSSLALQIIFIVVCTVLIFVLQVEDVDMNRFCY